MAPHCLQNKAQIPTHDITVPLMPAPVTPLSSLRYSPWWSLRYSWPAHDFSNPPSMFSLQPLMSTVCSVLIFLKMGSRSQISSIFCVKTSEQHRPRQTFFHLNNGLYCFFFKKVGGDIPLATSRTIALCHHLPLAWVLHLPCVRINLVSSITVQNPRGQLLWASACLARSTSRCCSTCCPAAEAMPMSSSGARETASSLMTR